MKFAKRKLRVQRCKANPAAANKAKAKPALPSDKTKAILDPSHFITRTSADHAARAAELAALPKDERKAVKAADPDRLARRMAKKKSRHALGAVDAAAKDGKGLLGKRRTTAGPAAKAAKAKAKTPRVRSEKAAAKRNAKK